MKPKHLMICGAAAGIVFGVLGSLAPGWDATVSLFAAGAIFGKGYGIFEARSGKPS